MSKAQMKDSDMEKVTLTTKEKLQKQPKEKIRLYINPDKKKQLEAQIAAGKKVNWPFTTVQINGYTYQIQYGKEVEVPESVAEILRQAEMI